MKFGYAHAARAYADMGRHASVEAASPHRLVQMLFEGALDRMAAARGALARRDIATKCNEIGRAVRIVEGLRMSLDRRLDTPLTANLDELYDYIGRRLLLANLNNDDAILDECARLLREVKAGWDEIPMHLRDGVPAQSADLAVAVGG